MIHPKPGDFRKPGPDRHRLITQVYLSHTSWTGQYNTHSGGKKHRHYRNGLQCFSVFLFQSRLRLRCVSCWPTAPLLLQSWGGVTAWTSSHHQKPLWKEPSRSASLSKSTSCPNQHGANWGIHLLVCLLIWNKSVIKYCRNHLRAVLASTIKTLRSSLNRFSFFSKTLTNELHISNVWLSVAFA